jgi:hypothetical protein
MEEKKKKYEALLEKKDVSSKHREKKISERKMGVRGIFIRKYRFVSS